MNRIIKWVLVFAAVIVLTSAAFTVYANFLLDYSLERLEMAVEATGKQVEDVSPVSRNIYRDVIRDLAIEESTKERVDYKNLALLELASSTFSEAVENTALKKANVYLRQVIESKLTDRGLLLRITDSIYYFVSRFFRQTASFLEYLLERFFPKRETSKAVEYSSILLLNQAEEKLREGKFEEAAALYQKHMDRYPMQEERGFVAITLAGIYVRLHELEGARDLLQNVRQGFAGREEAVVAFSMLKKIGGIEKKEQLIRQLQDVLPKQQDEVQREVLQLKLALAYLSSYQFDPALEILNRLKDSEKKEIRNKAVFYIGWIHKLEAEYEVSATAFLDLLDNPDIERDLQLGLKVQLADIYYQQGEIEKSAEQLKNLAQSIDPKEIEEKILEEVWLALSELEQAKIYHYDFLEIKDAQQTIGREMSEMGIGLKEFSDLASELTANPRIGMRERGFHALENGRVHFALDLFEKDLVRHPRDPWTLAGLGTVYLFLGDLEKGESLARQGYEIQPDYYTASILGYVYALLQRFDAAEALYREALGRNPDYMPARFNMASIYLKMGKYQQGLGLLGRLERDMGGEAKLLRAKVLNNMGYAYWQMGDHERAKERFEEALRIMPQFGVAKNNLSQIAVGEIPEMVKLSE